MNRMKKTIWIVLPFVLLTAMVLAVVAWNAFHSKREFIVLYNKELNFCFLIDDRYKYEVLDNAFIYSGGKNEGRIELIKASLSDDILKVNINEFNAGYKKTNRKRIYEYEVENGYILRDTFRNISMSPVNLVPYKSSCEKIKSNFKKHREIFRSQK